MFSANDRYADVFTDIIGTEGNYVNNPKDPGGETKYGISKRSYPNVDIKNLTLEQAKSIYFNDYWTKLGCDKLPLGLDEFVFDFGVNSGTSLVARKLQAACGTLQDGIVGPNTLAAVNRAGAAAVFRILFVERAILWASQPKEQFEEFGHGWFARLHDKSKEFFLTAKVS